MKDLSKIIREFEKLPYESYERRKPKHDPIYSYVYLARHIEKCMMRYYALNLHVYPVIMEITGTQQISIARLFYGQEQIKIFPSGRKFIAGLFYGQKQIKNHYSRLNFYE